ncbi:hypothetical protein MGYG_03246 [Nannizzia gypsea CBS 118893]|uniref:Uncharacterized protein n=1 Tax=Arthroderma gypseum (strain ATCC MYA-4604 / CBS 118893) TaxID=535722 RepID=E4URN3_ARTGP|nr:hypothetical protein MGYG_03246 [Nannizzia gypsea CBS 118893]EFR00243.1 hypothetical protein MGYG_03246 [Nannizzia gypsea CBS 118893]
MWSMADGASVPVNALRNALLICAMSLDALCLETAVESATLMTPLFRGATTFYNVAEGAQPILDTCSPGGLYVMARTSKMISGILL